MTKSQFREFLFGAKHLTRTAGRSSYGRRSSFLWKLVPLDKKLVPLNTVCRQLPSTHGGAGI